MAHQARAPAHRSTSSTSAASPPRSKATPASSIISKGATARSAVSPRVTSSVNGRAKTPSVAGSSPRSSPVPSGELHANGRDALVASLKREADEKEELLLRLQEKETQLAELTSENTSITSSLHAAETRLTELYADQSRMEEDIATRIEIAEKLRSQVRDLEKEKRDALRRYTEQTATFEAERQALYDNEQHLKSRIQSLTSARKQETAERPASPVPSIAPSISLSDAQPASPTTPVAHPPLVPETEVSDGPEITALKLELSTLSTSHTSLQTMVQMLQTELADLKRVNNELQEENESYGLLLMERAMNGTGVEMIRHMAGDDQSSRAETVSIEEERTAADDGEKSSLRSGTRSILDRVSEHEEFALEDGLPLRTQPNSLASELQAGQGLEPPPFSRRRRTRPNSASSSPRGTTPLGETLADLPITGPGLDLAAELGRAETKDILDGNAPAGSIGIDQQAKGRATRKISDAAMESGKDTSVEVDALRQEVKSLKDANKALSLYASKIIDRIIMQEGFEHVLAVDYDTGKPPSTPKSPGAFEEVLAKAKESPPKPKVKAPTMLLSRSLSSKLAPSPSGNRFKFPSVGEPEKLTTFDTTPTPAADVKKNRRSLSIDWKAFSMFGGSANAPSNKEKEKYLRPLTLRPGAGSALASARKLDSQEDEDDRKERERLNATMKLMGIEKPPEDTPAPLVLKTTSSPPATGSAEAAGTKSPSTGRFSLFRSMTANFTSQAAATPAPAPAPANLTSEALEQAEAETTLASLDAREKVLTAEIAKGGGGGFTELNAEGRMSLGDQWRSRRTRSASGKSHDSSGASTVWSAGMKGDEE